ncbi:copper homeostasis protein CutC [Rasiella sp. SM2506]|uniref:copper homeostasis protein CutC n=1 Tax=Rasiella sp. SM2506 TaxID=3423914 RepID=UPI003D79BB16
MLLEICANSFESAFAAQEAGADRIELCTELSVGGLTPSFGLLEKVLVELTIPIHVLIRPRSGNFTYTEAELDIMLRDIETCKELGCDGIVSGALTSELEIDLEVTKLLNETSGSMEFTFHRAFDWVKNPEQALEQLIALDIPRLLSSGQKSSALEGILLLKALQNKANGHIQVMPGGGINVNNCLQFKQAGFYMIHCSATDKVQTLTKIPNVSMHSASFFEEGIVATTSEKTIREIKALLTQ